MWPGKSKGMKVEWIRVKPAALRNQFEPHFQTSRSRHYCLPWERAYWFMWSQWGIGYYSPRESEAVRAIERVYGGERWGLNWLGISTTPP